jgi:hypothetical protein
VHGSSSLPLFSSIPHYHESKACVRELSILSLVTWGHLRVWYHAPLQPVAASLIIASEHGTVHPCHIAWVAPPLVVVHPTGHGLYVVAFHLPCSNFVKRDPGFTKYNQGFKEDSALPGWSGHSPCTGRPQPFCRSKPLKGLRATSACAMRSLELRSRDFTLWSCEGAARVTTS